MAISRLEYTNFMSLKYAVQNDAIRSIPNNASTTSSKRSSSVRATAAEMRLFNFWWLLNVFFVAAPLLIAAGLFVLVVSGPVMMQTWLDVFADWLSRLAF